MSQTIEAIYENGAFKPLGPVDLPEGTRVRIDVATPTADDLEQVRQQLLSEGHPPEAIDTALATIRQLQQCFEGLTDEQWRIMDEARLDQVNFFNRPED
jgi:predicted DNA-binding antitoxin AbrB/MazE fold protein